MSPERAPFSTLSFPVGSLGIIAMDSCKELGEHVDRWLISERQKEMRGAEAPVSFLTNRDARGSATARQRRLSMNRFAEKTYIFWWISEITAVNTTLWAWKIICLRMIIMPTSRGSFQPLQERQSALTLSCRFCMAAGSISVRFENLWTARLRFMSLRRWACRIS